MKMMYIVFFALLSFGLSAGGTHEVGNTFESSAAVNVYSSRHYDVDRLLFAQFNEETGIQVNTVLGGSDEIVERLRSEGENSPADILILVDAHHLNRAKDLGLYRQADIDLSNLNPRYRDSENHWFGISKRARVIVLDARNPLPDSLGYADLAGQAFSDSLLIRSSSNIYNLSLLASIIVNEGYNAAQDWAAAVRQNMARPPQGNDRDQMRALIAGVGSAAVVNTYYVGLLINSYEPADQMVGNNIAVIFPDQDGRGAHISLTGAGITAAAPNAENAHALLQFLLSVEAQEAISEMNFEFPVRDNAQASALLRSWGNFREDETSLSEIADAHSDAVQIFDAVGWE